MNKDYHKTTQRYSWCSEHHQNNIFFVLKQILTEAAINLSDVVIVYDIGCVESKTNLSDVYGFHGLNGRALPVAQGVKLTNPNLRVIAFVNGDVESSIGVGHFIHACRRNIGITYVVHNQICDFTKSQFSPKSDLGMITKTSPSGNLVSAVNLIALSLVSGASFISRTFSGNPRHLKDILKSAILHKGFSIVDVLYPCFFNQTKTYEWLNSKVYYLEKDSNYDRKNFNKALSKSFEWEEKIPLGIFYEQELPTYEEKLNIRLDISFNKENPALDVSSLLREYEV